MTNMMMARVYLVEGEKQLKQVMSYLHDTAKVRGVTVFRGISGFGQSGEMHSAALLDLSMHLPITIEFFDTKECITSIVDYLGTILEPGHIAWWPITVKI